MDTHEIAMDEDIRELYEERASIIEFEGGVARELAEQLAWTCVQNVQDVFDARQIGKVKVPAHDVWAGHSGTPKWVVTGGADTGLVKPKSATTGIILRDYQQRAVEETIAALARGELPVCAMATGSGKSACIAELCRRLDGRILVVTHRKELLQQNLTQLQRLLGEGVDAGIYSAGLNKREGDNRVVFGGVQSIYRKMEALQKDKTFQYIIIDEAHRTPGRDHDTSMYAQVFNACPGAQLIGLTATPYRLDNGPLHEGDHRWFTSMPVNIGIKELTPEYLAPLHGVYAVTDAEVQKVLARVRTQQDEYVTSDLSQAMSEEALVESSVQEMIELATGRHSWLVFCVDVAHTKIVTDRLVAKGITAQMLVGTTPADERKEMLRAFRAGEFRCLVNCEILTTGFDAPNVDCLVCLRPTKSKSLFVQMLGRGTRKHEVKDDCLILDYSGNMRRFEPLDEVPVREDSPKIRIAKEQEKALDEQNKREKERLLTHKASVFDASLEQTYPVVGVRYARHGSKKFSALSLLRVDYKVSGRKRGYVSQWLCVEYTGYPRRKAEAWFHRRGLRCPQTVQEALRMLEKVGQPTAILVRETEPFPEVVIEYFDTPEGSDGE